MSLSEQLQSLRSEQGRLVTAIKDAGERIGSRLSSLEAKLAVAGEPDPDIQGDIDALRASINQINAIGADAEQTAGKLAETAEVDNTAAVAEEAPVVETTSAEELATKSE